MKQTTVHLLWITAIMNMFFIALIFLMDPHKEPTYVDEPPCRVFGITEPKHIAATVVSGTEIAYMADTSLITGVAVQIAVGTGVHIAIGIKTMGLYTLVLSESSRDHFLITKNPTLAIIAPILEERNDQRYFLAVRKAYWIIIPMPRPHIEESSGYRDQPSLLWGRARRLMTMRVCRSYYDKPNSVRLVCDNSGVMDRLFRIMESTSRDPMSVLYK